MWGGWGGEWKEGGVRVSLRSTGRRGMKLTELRRGRGKGREKGKNRRKREEVLPASGAHLGGKLRYFEGGDMVRYGCMKIRERNGLFEN